MVTIDLSHFNTSKVKSMQSMFQNCYALVSLDLSSFSSENLENISYMFHMNTDSNNLESIVFSEKFTISKVTTVRNMFCGCVKIKTLDLSHFDTSRVTKTDLMFYRCSSLTDLNLQNASFSQVETYDNMFTSSIPSTITITVKDATEQAWLQERLGSGKGNFVIAS